MGFVAQFYGESPILAFADLLCIQVYQDLEDYDPLPVVVTVPQGARENRTNLGLAKPGVIPHSISWEYREDPDLVEDWRVDLAKSKSGGTCYFLDCIQPGERLLLQLEQQPCGLNFGGYTLVLSLTKSGQIRVTLG